VNSTENYRSRLQDTARAQDYAFRFERGPRRKIDQLEQRAVRALLAKMPECRTVLDVPCGAGRFLPNLSANQRQVIEMDQAAEVIEFAQNRAQDLGLKAQFLQGDAAMTGLPNTSVDLVFCNRLLHHIVSANERAVFLREFHRVSKRYLLISFFDYRSFQALRVFFKRLRGRNPDYTGQPTLTEFCEEVARSGFEVKEVMPTGAIWVAEKYLLAEKKSSGGK
jgi:SAM-dependent methyltransferase